MSTKKAAPKDAKATKVSKRVVQARTADDGSSVEVQGKVGKPSKYSPEVVEAICERLSKGEPLAQICRDKGMPKVTTLWDWQNDKDNPDRAAQISERFARAREVGYDAIATKCLDIADDNTTDVEMVEITEGVTVERVNHDVVQRAKLRIETRLKLLACWDPKRYGTKIDHTSGGKTIVAPVVTFQAAPDA
jgi:hypothetical protein